MAGITAALTHDGNHNSVGYTYANITSTTAGTVIKGSQGVLHSLVLNTPAATAVVTLYDNASAASGTIIGTFTVASGQPAVSLVYDITFTNGLVIKVATAACDITISYI